MNNEMAYLLGMICGNGEIRRGNFDTTISIDIPHKKLQTELIKDVQIYVKASIADIRSILEPLMGAQLNFIQNPQSTTLSFRKSNDDFLIREIIRHIGHATNHSNIRIHNDIFNFTRDQKIQFLKGFSDVTGYIRKSNYFFEKHLHRVYLEIPNNWYLVIDICNLLHDIDIPVQNIDWAHPNMRDPSLKKYNKGKTNFWKKEHQIKIWANEFLPIGFEVLHKMEMLEIYSDELISGIKTNGKDPSKYTHRYYWETRKSNVTKDEHPGRHDDFIPEKIRGMHFNTWKEIAKELGYPSQMNKHEFDNPISEYDLYEPMRIWLHNYISDKYKGYEIITTIDSHKEKLEKTLERYNVICEAAIGIDIQIDIVGIAKKKSDVKLFFIEAKKTSLTLKDLGQLWAYCKLIDPEEAFLLTSKGLGSLNKIFNLLHREDLLDFGNSNRIKKMKIAVWNIKGRTPDFSTMIPKL